MRRASYGPCHDDVATLVAELKGFSRGHLQLVALFSPRPGVWPEAAARAVAVAGHARRTFELDAASDALWSAIRPRLAGVTVPGISTRELFEARELAAIGACELEPAWPILRGALAAATCVDLLSIKEHHEATAPVRFAADAPAWALGDDALALLVDLAATLAPPVALEAASRLLGGARDHSGA